MQSVAAEFNTSITAFLVRADADAANPQFHIRWFTPVRESELCGHGTLAAAHYLISSGLVKCNAIDFLAKSGFLTAKKVVGLKQSSTLISPLQEACTKFLIELDFPLIPVVKCSPLEMPSIPETLNGASVSNVLKTVSDSATDLIVISLTYILSVEMQPVTLKFSCVSFIVELNSSEEVVNVRPNISELVQSAGRGVAVTGPAPVGSSYDFFSRFFCPKYGLNEDPVCGSVHCALAPYWGKKLGKQCMTASMASPRSGTLYLQWDEAAQRVQIRGEAVTVMVGNILV
nr:Phenazine biosynthesis-like protein, expressed [Oryza sativa Japonica Group]